MTNIRKISQIIALSLAMVCVVLIVVLLRKDSVKSAVPPTFVPIAAVPSPTQIPQPKLQTNSMDSPEGSKTLTLERVESAGSVSHSAFVTDVTGGNRHDILSSDARYQDLSIPYNTWSPDTVYFFLKETLSDRSDYLVFQSSGEHFAEDSLSLSIRRLFEEKVQGYGITDVTGWASPTQLIVNTKAIEGDARVSFWFDVPSQTFIQLGTYFQ